MFTCLDFIKSVDAIIATVYITDIRLSDGYAYMPHHVNTNMLAADYMHVTSSEMSPWSLIYMYNCQKLILNAATLLLPLHS